MYPSFDLEARSGSVLSRKVGDSCNVEKLSMRLCHSTRVRLQLMNVQRLTPDG
jgi:hypothetical protein